MILIYINETLSCYSWFFFITIRYFLKRAFLSGLFYSVLFSFYISLCFSFNIYEFNKLTMFYYKKIDKNNLTVDKLSKSKVYFLVTNIHC